jgi:HK97 family phage portal protein
MASLPLDLKRYSVAGAGKFETGDPLYNVLRWRPNISMEAFTFWTAMWASEQLWGAGYAEIKRNGGKVVALQFLLPQYVTTYLTEKKQLRFRYDDPREPRDFAADQVFRVFTRSLDGLTGVSVIEFARNSFGLAQSGEIAASKTFKKGLNASGFVQTEKFLTEPQREMMRTSVDEFTGETDKAGGTMVLEGGFTYSQLSMKPLDAELLSSRQFSVEDVCRWFGVPPILIGHASGGQTMWGSGVEQIFSGWSRLSLRPYVTACTQSVRSQLILPEDRDALYAEYDLDDLLAADSIARSQLYSTLAQNGIKTRDELRALEGLGPMPGGDKLTVQSNLIPLDKLGEIVAGAGGSGGDQKLRNAFLDFLGIDTLQKNFVQYVEQPREHASTYKIENDPVTGRPSVLRKIPEGE